MNRLAEVNRPGNEYHAARPIANPFFQRLNLFCGQVVEIGVDGNNRVVGEKLLRRGGELGKDFASFLRDVSNGGLQERVQFHGLVTRQKGSEELVFSRRPAGKEQNLQFAVCGLDDDGVGIVGLVGLVRQRADFYGVFLLPDRLRGNFKGDLLQLVVRSQNDALG